MGALFPGMQRPGVSGAAQDAIAVWSFCAGWHPELVPMAAVYYEVKDMDLLMDLLLTIRHAVAVHERAQR